MATMQQQMGSAKESAGSAIDLARTSIAPRAFNVGPPNYYTQTSFVKKLDVVANITVNDNLANGATSIRSGKRFPHKRVSLCGSSIAGAPASTAWASWQPKPWPTM
jgi:hypothetical protein